MTHVGWIAAVIGQLERAARFGAPAEAALRALAEEHSGARRAAVLRIAARLAEGRPLSLALSEERRIPAYIPRLIQIAERDDRVSSMLAQLSENLHADAAVSEQLASRLRNNALTLGVMGTAFGFLAVFVGPAYRAIFQTTEQILALQRPCQNVVTHEGFIVLSVVSLCVVAILVAAALVEAGVRATGRSPHRLDVLREHMPIYFRARRACGEASAAGALSMLLDNGVPDLEARRLAMTALGCGHSADSEMAVASPPLGLAVLRQWRTHLLGMAADDVLYAHDRRLLLMRTSCVLAVAWVFMGWTDTVLQPLYGALAEAGDFLAMLFIPDWLR